MFLLAGYLHPVNTYSIIKHRKWMHNIFETFRHIIPPVRKVSCKKSMNKRPFSPRIPLSYIPVVYISADVTYMPIGIHSCKFMLVTTCKITVLLVAVPLVKNDVVSSAHAMVDRIFLVFGPLKGTHH